MKKTMKLLAVGMLFVGGIFAQATPKKGDPCEKLNKTEQWMKDSLSLSSEQTTKIETLHKETCIKFQNAGQEAAGNRDALKENRKAIMGSLRDSYKEILNEDQLKKLKAHHKQHKDSAGHKGKHLSAATRADTLTQVLIRELELTPTQIPQVKALNLELVKHRDEMRELKKSGADSQTLKAKNSEFMKGYKQKMQDVLTDDQEKKLKEWRKSHKGRRGNGAKPEDE